MGTTRLELVFDVPQPVGVVLAHLADHQLFVAIHPVISRMQATGPGQYLVHETLKVAGLPYSFTYPATIEADQAARTVRVRATVARVVHVQMDFRLSGSGQATTVRETVTFRSWLPVGALMAPVFRQQHAQLFQNLGQVTSQCQ
jgi:carbon monoxide dehydrogenase subunit G